MLIEALVELAVVVDRAQQLLHFVVQVFFFQFQSLSFIVQRFPRLDQSDLFKSQSHFMLFELLAKLDADGLKVLL